MTLTYGSLFSGIGGFDLALDRAGLRCLWQVEKDRHCRTVLARHWPDVERHEDVCNVGRTNLAPVDLICGGFPCQDISVAGRRAGLAGQRSGLWWEFHRIIGELSPRWVLAENVDALVSSHSPVEDAPEPVRGATWEVDETGDLATIVASLVDLGYGVAWRVFDAQHFGVPQRRRRIFLVGHLGEPWSAPASVLFEPESVPGNPAPRTDEGADTAGGTLVGTLQGGGTRGHRIGAEEAGGATRCLVAALTSSHGGPDDNEAQAGHLIAIGSASQPASQPANQPTRALTSHAGRYDGDTESFVVMGLNHRQDPIVADDKSLPLDTDESVVFDVEVRRLTPLERERLTGLPDGWTAGVPASARNAQTGNAVVVPVVEWIARRLVAVDAELQR